MNKRQAANLTSVNEVICRSIRPKLQEHNGDIDVISVEDGIVKVAFKGACKGCPGAQMTIEDVVNLALQEEIEGINEVRLVNQMDDSMLNLARQLLNKS